MYQRARLITITLAPALLLIGCGGTQNRGLESVHQPVVTRSDYALDLATGGGGLAPGEEGRLAGWMAALRLGYGDRVSIDENGSYGAGVREDVSREVARYGLLVADDAPVGSTSAAAGMIRVTVTRMKASVPGCPDFSRMREPEFESNTSSNQGCATNANIAAMVASPGDLVRGQTSTGLTDVATAGKAIDLYRRAVPSGGGGTAIKTESTAGSK